MRSTWGWITAIAIGMVALLVVGWLVRLVEGRLAFFPLSGEDVTPQAFGVEFTATTVSTADGERVLIWHLPRSDGRARVVYFHGNGGNLSMWAPILVDLWRQGFELYALDYRGYGLSTGAPTEQGLYRDVEATLAFVAAPPRDPAMPLVYWGRSLGTTMAAYAASVRAPDGVVLEAGFPSIRGVLQGNPLVWLLSFASSYRFPTAAFMSAVECPTLVLHGDRDEVIPFRQGQRLFESIRGPKTFVAIPGGRHNDSVPADTAAYWNAVHDFATRLRPPGAGH
ncbi:MAG: alpha/beta hydrolase [Acidobacteriota bacterium]